MADGKGRPNARAVHNKQRAALVALLLYVLLVLSIISISDVACQLSLRPLYGGASTARHFPTVSLLVCLMAAFTPKPLPLQISFAIMSVWLAASPVILYRVGVRASAWLDPIWGPIVCHIVGILPITLLGAAMLQDILSHMLPSGFLPHVAKLCSGMLSWFAITRADGVLWDNLPLGGFVNGCSMYLFLGLITSLPAALLAFVSVSRKRGKKAARGMAGRLSMNPTFISGLSLAIPLLISVLSQGQSPCRTPTVPYTTLDGTVRILDRAFSTTGMILVGETDLDGIRARFLRCDQSLLGGMWLLPEHEGGPSTRLFQSIYATFYLQEAVRLVNRPQGRTTPQRVLNIGLGIGVAARAFIDHGMSTTIIEIDPAVYRFAREHFEFPEPTEVYLEDARDWVRRRARDVRSLQTSSLEQAEGRFFDYVVHDCFSGGGVPQHLYTLEFWGDLKAVMSPSGVIGINFAGRLDSPAMRGVLVTLLAAFGECRVYHDSDPGRNLEKLKEDFVNMIIICSLAPPPLTFRSSVSDDYLGNKLRQLLFNSWDSREIPLRTALGSAYLELGFSQSTLLLRDTSNKLGEWQEQSAREHWRLMRGVLSPEVWNIY